MKQYTTEIGIVAPLDRANVDTDLIIPKQFLKSIKRTGFGDNLFDELRYLDEGYLGQDISKRPKNPDFVLNQERYTGATILLARANFGCGSSREHAPWALSEFGFRTVIAPSFADIFYNNCFKNGMLPVVLSDSEVDELFQECFANTGYQLTVDLQNQTVISPSGRQYHFEVDGFRKHCLLNGLDDIGLTLQNSDDIKAFEEKARKERPWVFGGVTIIFDIKKIIQELAKKRPVFHSEADFQHAFAWEIHIHYPNANIRIERPYMIEGKKFYIDLIVEIDKKIIAIELKYKTKIPKDKIEMKDECFDLKNHGAQNWGRYHFINDIVRLEKLSEKYPVSQGYAIFLTNDLYYQSKPKKDVDYFDFCLDSQVLAGILKWKDEKKIDKTLQLKNSYKFDWQQYEENFNFHYLIVKV